MTVIRAYTSAVTKAYTRAVIPGYGAAFDGLAPSALTLTVLSDTSIKLDFTVNSTDRDGHKIERSTDGTNYTVIDTVLTDTATYTNTGATENTRYYYRVRAYKDSSYSAYCTVANDYTAIKMVLTSTGTGEGVSTAVFRFDTVDVVGTLDGNGKWYSDSSGTLDESASYTFVAGANRFRYVKVTSGTSNLLLFAKNNFITFIWAGLTNTPSIAKNISNITTLKTIEITGKATLTGSVTNITGLENLKDWSGTSSITGDVTSLTSLKSISLTSCNEIIGSIENHTSLIDVYMTTANVKLSGDIGKNNVVNGITSFQPYIGCRFVDYTGGASWTLASNTAISPDTGYGYSATEIDNILIDMAASLGTVTAKTITLKGSSAARTSASDAAVTTLNGKGWTVVTN